MKTLRALPTPLQRFLRQDSYVESEVVNFLFDADGVTVYAETHEGWVSIKPNYTSD